MENYVSIREATSTSTLSYQHIASLARNKKINSRKSGNVWLIDLESLKEHEKQMAVLGSKKHSHNR